jgi:hypothetical protein
MQRAAWIIPILLLPGCGAVPQQPLILPAPLEGEMVEQGHLCDPRALTEAISHKYPSIDPATASQEANHLLYTFGCGPPAPAPPSFAALSFAAPLAPDLRAQGEEIPLERQGNTYSVTVLVNGIIAIPFVLDTGAGDVLLPADVVFTLLRTGTLHSSDFTSYRPYILADGRELPSAQFKIRELKVGQHTARDVISGVGRLGSDALLGQSFLSRFGSAAIDYKRNVLVLSR